MNKGFQPGIRVNHGFNPLSPRAVKINSLDVGKNFDREWRFAQAEEKAGFNKVVRRQSCDGCAKFGMRQVNRLAVVRVRFNKQVKVFGGAGG
jgi:hypothetical protein